ncbi:hypothetical protein Syun_029145 [Stephania yunnanensis]|uniref:Uncharacterized protein n=1 Tax=Stephania yunnanensis TaxID=152371 RepID=A0AAP0E536_9MAGN
MDHEAWGDQVVAVTGGSSYKGERLRNCSLITLITGMIKARPEIVGGWNLVAAWKAGTEAGELEKHSGKGLGNSCKSGMKRVPRL